LRRSSFVAAVRAGWSVPFNTIGDFDTLDSLSTDAAVLAVSPQFRRLEDVDDDLTLPLTERYFLGGLGQFQLRGFKARSVGPRRRDLRKISGTGNVFTPVGIDDTGQCVDNTCQRQVRRKSERTVQPDHRPRRRRLRRPRRDRRDRRRQVHHLELRISLPDLGDDRPPGGRFIDMGNAFDEREWNLFDVTEWRYGTGAGVQWFSPFGPLAVVLGFPLDRLSVEDPTVFEFSIGGSAF
jgi:outer membrane protein assembly factor BamA